MVEPRSTMRVLPIYATYQIVLPSGFAHDNTINPLCNSGGVKYTSCTPENSNKDVIIQYQNMLPIFLQCKWSEELCKITWFCSGRIVWLVYSQHYQTHKEALFDRVACLDTDKEADIGWTMYANYPINKCYLMCLVAYLICRPQFDW